MRADAVGVQAQRPPRAPALPSMARPPRLYKNPPFAGPPPTCAVKPTWCDKTCLNRHGACEVKQRSSARLGWVCSCNDGFKPSRNLRSCIGKEGTLAPYYVFAQPNQPVAANAPGGATNTHTHTQHDTHTTRNTHTPHTQHRSQRVRGKRDRLRQPGEHGVPQPGRRLRVPLQARLRKRCAPHGAAREWAPAAPAAR